MRKTLNNVQWDKRSPITLVEAFIIIFFSPPRWLTISPFASSFSQSVANLHEMCHNDGTALLLCP